MLIMMVIMPPTSHGLMKAFRLLLLLTMLIMMVIMPPTSHGLMKAFRLLLLLTMLIMASTKSVVEKKD